MRALIIQFNVLFQTKVHRHSTLKKVKYKRYLNEKEQKKQVKKHNACVRVWASAVGSLMYRPARSRRATTIPCNPKIWLIFSEKSVVFMRQDFTCIHVIQGWECLSKYLLWGIQKRSFHIHIHNTYKEQITIQRCGETLKLFLFPISWLRSTQWPL